MNIYIGSYNKGIYEVKINEKTNKIGEITQLNDVVKPAYLLDLGELSYIYSKDGKQYAKVENDDVLLTHPACHLSYDRINDLVYTSHYHDSLLKVLKKIDNKWTVINEIAYEEKSRVHYVEFIETINLLGVCNLGDDLFRLYEVNNGELVEKTNYKLKEHVGPRHFVYNKELPIIYIINEHTPSITVLSYENGKLELLQDIMLVDGSASAIRMTKNNNYVFAAVRNNDFIYSFKIQKNGLLEVIQKVHTLGDHPRDFNLVLDDKYLLVPNMKSNNLTLFSVNEGKLTLVDQDVKFDAGAVVISK